VSQSFLTRCVGYPTGVGCLNRPQGGARPSWRRPWFAGRHDYGSRLVQGDRYYLAEGASAFEDGTPNYLALPGVAFRSEYT
jgi:selenocysteine lyase/cysteine desulfurase